MQKAQLLLVIGLACGAITCPAQENLVRNPGFEDSLTTNGLPGGGWWLSDGLGNIQVKADDSLAHSGKATARLHADTPAKGVLVSHSFPVAPEDELRFEAWVRGESLQTNAQSGFAGLAFRRADGGIFERAFFRSEALTGNWALISGVAKAPAEAVTAEVHLRYTNAPGTLWFDDVTVAITSPVSFSLVQGAQPWPGEQQITVRVVNRQTNQFRGVVAAVVGKRTNTVPVSLEARASREIKVPITLNQIGAHDYRLSLLDAAGAPLRVLHGKFHTRPPLVLYPACPCYHAAGQGTGETRIDARINLNPARRAGLRLNVEVTDAAGKTLQTAAADASQGETAGVVVRVPVAGPGVFSVTARLLDGEGKEIAAANTEIRVCPRELSRVEIGPDGFLRVGGQPHFPIGLYSAGRYEEMGRAGFTATHNYGITTGEADETINPNEAHLQELLDQSWANGLRMMVELPRKAIEKAQWPQVRRRIETFRHHPGLLCWGSEERVARGIAPLANVAALYRLVHELDPDHPLVLGDTRDVITKLQKDRRDFFPDACMDAGIWWWYPIPLKEPDGNGLQREADNAGLMAPPAWLTTTLSQKPLWIAIQSYQQPSRTARFPTPAEYRCMAYLSLINGVKGLWFYTGSGQRDYLGRPSGLLNKPEEGHWDYVRQLARELRELSPVIMAPRCAAKLQLSPAAAPVEFTTREADGKVYLVAANKSDHPQKVRFNGEMLKGKSVQVLYESHPATLKAGSLADEFPAFGVHVYRLE